MGHNTSFRNTIKMDITQIMITTLVIFGTATLAVHILDAFTTWRVAIRLLEVIQDIGIFTLLAELVYLFIYA